MTGTNPYRAGTKRYYIAYHILNGLSRTQTLDAMRKSGKFKGTDEELKAEIGRTFAALEKEAKKA